jgi:hypothetical protein
MAPRYRITLTRDILALRKRRILHHKRASLFPREEAVFLGCLPVFESPPSRFGRASGIGQESVVKGRSETIPTRLDAKKRSRRCRGQRRGPKCAALSQDPPKLSLCHSCLWIVHDSAERLRSPAAASGMPAGRCSVDRIVRIIFVSAGFSVPSWDAAQHE